MGNDGAIAGNRELARLHNTAPTADFLSVFLPHIYHPTKLSTSKRLYGQCVGGFAFNPSSFQSVIIEQVSE